MRFLKGEGSWCERKREGSTKRREVEALVAAGSRISQARQKHSSDTGVSLAAGFMRRNAAKFHSPDFEFTERFFPRTS